LKVTDDLRRKTKVVAKKAKIPDPLSEIASNLVAALEAHRSAAAQGADTPLLTWSQLLASQSGVSTDWATAALLKAPAKGQILIAVADDLKSPVGLTKDVERLAQDPAVLHRLVQHPSTGCSELVPVRTLADLCKSVDRNLRKPLESFWTQNAKKLPAGLLSAEQRVGKKIVVGIHDERFARPDVTLSRKLTAALESLRKLGDSSYPALLSDVLTRADVSSDDSQLASAFAQPPFAETTMLVAGKLPDGWLALRTDADQVVNSEGFLRRLLLRHCNEATPEVKLSALSKVLVKDLQTRFGEVWRTHFDLQRKFPFVEFFAAGSKTKPDLILRDARFPRAEKVLSEQLVKQLEHQKAIGESAYPSTWNRLVELTKTTADKGTLQKASAMEPFAGRVVLAFPALADSPVAFLDDAALLSGSARLIELLLAQLTSGDQQGVPADKLSAAKGLHPLLKPLVTAALEKFFSDRQLPTGLGGLRLSGKWHIFRLQDVTAGLSTVPMSEEPRPKAKKSASPASPRPAAQPAAGALQTGGSHPAATPVVPAFVADTGSAAAVEPESYPEAPVQHASSGPNERSGQQSSPTHNEPAVTVEPSALHEQATPPVSNLNESFAGDLANVFERLSEQSRLPGCVSLADLRPALSQYSREAFDAELIRMRKAGLYSLSVVEGRYPLSDAERDACLLIDNSPHLLVRRRAS
jgi:hypothetical protein